MRKRTPSDRPPDHLPPPDFAPVPRKCRRYDGWTPERQRAFVDALSDTGSVKAACAAVNMSAVGAYHLRRQPGAEAFAAAWDAALQHRMEILRDAVMERAIHGVEVPVYSYGKLVGARRVYNDRIAAFMLRNYDGMMSGGAAGQPLRIRRLIDEAVAQARSDWEAERAENEDDFGRHIRAHMDQVRARLIHAGTVDSAEEEAEKP
jgi:hypothetical protein